MGKKGPLTWVSPKEFKERTSLTLSSRSETTKHLDLAYSAYWESQSEYKAKQLYQALQTYLVEHGGSWNRCERDKVSGGLLQWMYNEVAPKGVRISTRRAAELDFRAQQLINTQEIPQTRFAVLYLLGNIRMEGDWVATAIEGVSVIGGAIGTGVSTDYTKLKGVEGSSKTMFKVFGQEARGSLAVTGGQTIMQIPQIALSVGGTVKAQSKVEPPTPDYFPRSAKVLTTAANTISSAYDHNKFLGILAGVGVTAIAIPAALGAVVADAAVMLYRLGKWLWEKITGAVRSVINMLRSKWNDGTTWMSEKFGMLVKMATKFVVDLVFKQAAPLVGAAIDLGTGIVKAVDAACTRIASALDRRQIRLHPGHPEETANAIEHSMTMGMFKGLADVLKGSGKLAVAVLLPGLGSLVSALMSAIEWLVKFLYRYFESERIDKFLERARREWQAEEQRMYAHALSAPRPRALEPGEHRRLQPVLDGKGIIADTAKFTAFFKEGCEASPLIPMLTLNSGICGSLMTLIKLFDDDGAQTRSTGGRSQFDIGASFFNRLKLYSADYLKASGFQFQPLVDTNNDIRNYLTHALQGHARPVNFGSKALAFIKAG